jgi:hypothetical protein
MAKVLAVLVVGAAIGAGTAYSIPAVWRVVAKGEASSSSYSFASASADVDKPRALRVRASGRSLELSAFFSCNIGDRRVRSGQAIVLTVASAQSCSVNASASAEDGGRVVVYIERRR